MFRTPHKFTVVTIELSLHVRGDAPATKHTFFCWLPVENGSTKLSRAKLDELLSEIGSYQPGQIFRVC